MAAFDKILSGYPSLDDFLDNIRLGDNVVWRVHEPTETFCRRQQLENGFHSSLAYFERNYKKSEGVFLYTGIFLLY